MTKISNGISPDYMISYLQNKLPSLGDEFEILESYAKENIVPIIQPEVANFLKSLIIMSKSSRILEIGTAIGYSALVFESVILESGKITTIEINEEKGSLAKENIKKYKNNNQVEIEVLIGDALDILPSVQEKYDFVFIDAGKSHYQKYFDYCNRLIDKDGIIVSDNVLYKGMVSSDELLVKRKKTIVKNMRNYLEYITNRSDFLTSIIPLGDGLAISVKNGDEIDE